MSQSYNPSTAVTVEVWANPLSLATTQGITIVFSSSGYLDVSVPRVRLHCWITTLHVAGLSHSDICGSIRICQSPQLFAAYHVLHRLWEPRHPPYALIYFRNDSNTNIKILGLPSCDGTRFIIKNFLFSVCQWTLPPVYSLSRIVNGSLILSLDQHPD